MPFMQNTAKRGNSRSKNQITLSTITYALKAIVFIANTLTTSKKLLERDRYVFQLSPQSYIHNLNIGFLEINS